MDLLQSVKKEGSRGGVSFSWSDVKDSKHRENYLGHSVMAPVGRWQKNKDLGWYAKADDADLTPEQREQKEREMRREELRKVKEAEEDAMAKALGLPVPDRSNANNEPLGMSREKQEEVNRALKETLDDREPARSDRRDDGRRERRERDDRGSRRHRRSRSRSQDRDRQRSSRYSERRERSRSRDRKQDVDRSRQDRRYDDRRRSHERDERSHGRRSRSRSPGHSRRHRHERR